MASKKKLLTSAVALGTAAALTLGGTFAWQSLNQTAVNEASNIVNPGGRLHDDFNGTNKDIYVENFADEAIFARVRLEEYFEVVMNLGVEGMETTETLIGDKTTTTNDDGTSTTKYTYVPFDFKDHVNDDGTVSAANIENLDTKPSMAAKADVDAEAQADDESAEEEKNITSYWQWTTGSDKSEKAYYMPTFNKNQDSLIADTNGAYNAELGAIIARNDEQYKDYTEYKENDSKSAYEVYDGDYDTVDDVTVADLKDLMANGKDAANYETTLKGHVLLSSEKIEHTAKEIGESKGLISLTEWLALNDGEYTAETHGGYWVYDDSVDKDGKATGNGWVYWSAPIEAGETTGRLLDSIKLDQKMDDSWYYAINVVGQFITADDLGEPGITDADGNTTGGTGFYADGETVPDDIKDMLAEIGVTVEEEEIVADTDMTLGDPESPMIAFQTADFGEGIALRKAAAGDGVSVQSAGTDDYTVSVMSGRVRAEEFCRLGLTEGKDYRLHKDVIVFTETESLPAGSLVEVKSEDGVGYIALGADDSLECRLMSSETSFVPADIIVAELNSEITMTYDYDGDGVDKTNLYYWHFNQFFSDTSVTSSNYDLNIDDGKLTIKNAELAGKLVTVEYEDVNVDSKCAFAYVYVLPEGGDDDSNPVETSLEYEVWTENYARYPMTDGETYTWCINDSWEVYLTLDEKNNNEFRANLYDGKDSTTLVDGDTTIWFSDEGAETTLNSEKHSAASQGDGTKEVCVTIGTWPAAGGNTYTLVLTEEDSETHAEVSKMTYYLQVPVKEISLAVNIPHYMTIAKTDAVRVIGSDGNVRETLPHVSIYQIEGGSSEPVALKENVDYTFADGMFQLKENGSASWGNFLMLSDDGEGSAYLFVSTLEEELTLAGSSDEGEKMQSIQATLNQPLTIKLSNGSAPTKIARIMGYTETSIIESMAESDYTYADGQITFKNADYADSLIILTAADASDNEYTGFIHLTAK